MIIRVLVQFKVFFLLKPSGRISWRLSDLSDARKNARCPDRRRQAARLVDHSHRSRPPCDRISRRPNPAAATSIIRISVGEISRVAVAGILNHDVHGSRSCLGLSDSSLSIDPLLLQPIRPQTSRQFLPSLRIHGSLFSYIFLA